MNNDELIEGHVHSVIYSNKENGYTVFSVDVDDEEIVCTGIVPNLNDGENVTLKGSFVLHPTYGKQFRILGYEKTAPQSTVGMERYLSSGIIKGIGPKMASKIVATFGDMTFEVIENYPEKLAKIKGITLDKAMEICAVFHEQSGQRNAMMFLQGYGLT
ncbi:MAG: ATP-dependent RecD-like DNA helicase, partial [Clostridiales bacterium]|nr:ATP-dependent RecD-like DNA helicase [Clostridiales bacterium]